jgi:glycine cleavage system transcriptional repressor
MSHYALTAVGPDQPGILAALTEPLVKLRCNLEDTSATILRGYFTLMMVVGVPDDTTLDAMLREVRARCDALDIHIEARPLPHLAGPAPVSTHVLSVYGADKPGIVFQVAQVLSKHAVNMLDLDTRLVGRAGRPIYAMLLEVQLPDGLAEQQLREDLDALGRSLLVDISLRPIEER